MKILHFVREMGDLSTLSGMLNKYPGRKAVVMSWPDYEIVEAFRDGRYTDLVMLYRAAANGVRFYNVDAIVHHSVPAGGKEDPFVLQANGRAPAAVVIYKYTDRFEYGGLPQ